MDSNSSINSESCLLTLNYAWYHVVGCTLQLLLLGVLGDTAFFTEAHNFGVFAMLADYGNMHLVKGTRTLQVLHEGKERGDVDDLNGFEVFLFFLWFDYWGSVALIVFARHVGDCIHKGSLSKVSILVILFQTLMWWTAPSLSHHLAMDDRVLLVARESPKLTYGIMLLVFSLLLFFHHKITVRHYISIIGSGISCALLHHLALFVHGMRGYNSIPHLLLTLATEWPALLCAEDYIRNTFRSNPQLAAYKRILPRSMILLLLAMMIPHAPSDEQLTEFLIAYLPGHIMQAFGTTFFRIKTCWLPKFSALECPQDDTIWVLSTTSKSGAVLSAKLFLDMAALCGYCVGSGSRDRAGIPGIVHAPTYPGVKLLHAQDMTLEWPGYVSGSRQQHKCVVITRDPLNRLRSFYTYTRSGGEHWVRYETDLMTTLRNAPSLEDSIQLFWDRVGKSYLQSSHDMFRIDFLNQHCTEVRFEDLTSNMNATLRRMLSVWQVPESAVDPLIARMVRHDRTGVSKQLLAKDSHASSKKFSSEFLARVEQIMSNGNEEIATMIHGQRLEMEAWRKRQQEEEGY